MSAFGLVLCAAGLALLPSRPVRLQALRRSSAERTVGVRTRAAIVWMSAAVFAVLVAVLGGLHLLAAAVVVAVTLRTRRRASLRRSRHRAEVESLIAGLETMVGELGVGAHPAVAAQVAAHECTGTVATAFLRASGRARLGGKAHDGVRVVESPVSSELSIVAAAWRIADDHGLGLVGLLTAARGDMLARLRFRDRTQASLAGARATGTVLACLPVVGVGLGQAMGASPLRVLVGGGVGGVLLVLGALLVCGGLLWTDAITEKVCR